MVSQTLIGNDQFETLVALLSHAKYRDLKTKVVFVGGLKLVYMLMIKHQILHALLLRHVLV